MLFCCGRGSCRGQKTRRDFVAAKSGFVTEDQAPRAKTHAWHKAALESPSDQPLQKHDDSFPSRIPSAVRSSNGSRPIRPVKPPTYSEAVSFVPGGVPPALSSNAHEDASTEQHTRKSKPENLQAEGIDDPNPTKEEQPVKLTGAQSGLEETSLAVYEARAFGWPRRPREGSVDGESVRPTWMPETESVTSGYTLSALSRWPGETGSIAEGSVRPEWMTDSVVAESVRPRWMGEDNGSEVEVSNRLVFQSAWTDETETSTIGSRTPGPFNDQGFPRVESVAPKSAAAAWMVEGIKSQRPHWITEAAERAGKRTPLRDAGRSKEQDHSRVLTAGASVVETANGKELQEASSADYKYFREAPPGEEPQANNEKALTSPKGTMGGQSSSEDAARPWTEIDHPPQDRDEPLQQQHETTEVKGSVGRRRKKVDHSRRHTTSPNHRPVKDSENALVDILKAQPPRQPTAEDPRKSRIPRSSTAPVSDTNVIDLVPRSKWIPLPPAATTTRAVSSSSSSSSGEPLHAQPQQRPHILAGASPARRTVKSSSPSPMGSRISSRSSSPAPTAKKSSSAYSTPVMRRPNKPTPQKQRKSSASPSPQQKGNDTDSASSNGASARRTPGKHTQRTPIAGRKQGRLRVTDKPQVSFAGIESLSSSSDGSMGEKNSKQPQARKRQRPVHNIDSNGSGTVDNKSFFNKSKGTKTPDRVDVRKEAHSSYDPTAAGETSRASSSPVRRMWPRPKESRGDAASSIPRQEGGKSQDSANAISGPSRASPLSKPLFSIRARSRFTPYLRRRLTPDLESVEEETIPPSSPVQQKPKQTLDTAPASRTSPALPNKNIKVNGRYSPSPIAESSERVHQKADKAPKGRIPGSGSPMIPSKIYTKTASPKAPAGNAPRVPPHPTRRLTSKDDLLIPASTVLLDGRDPDVRDLRDMITLSGGGEEDINVGSLKQRSKRLTLLKGSQRLSRSSSLDEWTDQHMPPRAMFSPNRFNPDAGVLSWAGSLDGSWCDSSVRSFMTGGTSSASLLSARGPSDKKLVAPQLSNTEKHEVARLKFNRGDVHFGYRPVRGSQRVYKAELNGEMRAAKVIDMLNLPKEAVPEVLETFDAELLSLTRLDTPNIVKVYGASVCPAEIILVSEFVEGGTLRDLLDNAHKLKRLHPRARLSIARDVAAGMRSLYAHGMQHRHLTSKAILLTHRLQAKIFGVGLSMTKETIAYFNDEEPPKDQVDGGHLLWASREVLAGAGFSEKSDVYSFGIVLWEIMQADGSLPYDGLRQEEVVAAKYNGHGPRIPRDTPDEISNLMESCWSNLPANRPSFDKVFELLTGLFDKKDHTARDSRFDDGLFDGAMSVP